MTLFTPALLLFVPLWFSAALLSSTAAQTSSPRSPSPRHGMRSDQHGEDGPEHWVALPFTPPSVHAA